MRDIRFHQLRALSLAAALVGWSFVSPRLPAGWRVVLQAGVGWLLVLVTRAPLGLRPPPLWAGLRLGSAAGAAAATAVAATASLPAVRSAISVRQLPAPAPEWLAVRIPVGTVWAEETSFRGALITVAAAAFGKSGGRFLQAAAFGLSHLPDARAMGEPPAATVLFTGIGGWLFGWLADRSGSLAAPLLMHLAFNEAGAVTTLVVQRRLRAR
jgi:membrane protease YdiL (CAAX protease family)